MENSQLISIIVPVFNVKEYISKCVDSIISQTYKCIEIILVDDGSSDTSGEICDDFVDKDSRVIVIHKENGGLSSARNAGLEIAHGEYVMFVDSDDFVEPLFCEISIKLILDKNVDIATFGYYRYEGEKKIEFKTLHPRYISASEGIYELIAKKDAIYNFAWNKIYKRSLFAGVSFPVGKNYEDQAITYLLFHKASIIYVSDFLLYNYVYRDTSISAEWDKPKSINDRFSIWLDRLNFIRKNYPENINEQINQIVNEAIKGFLLLMGKIKYRKSISMFSSFMNENRKNILALRNDKTIKLYYFNKYLFYLYCFYYRYRFLNK